MSRIAVVGASAGGLAAAEALRRAVYQGAITLVGDEPHLPYDRPPLSKQLLKGHWQADGPAPASRCRQRLSERQFLVAYRRGDRLAAGKPPGVQRAWRTLIVSRAAWEAAVTDTTAA